MKHTILAAVFGVLMAGSAFADMSQGDGARSPMADGSGREAFSRSHYDAPRQSGEGVGGVKAATIDPWKHDYAPFAQSGSMPVGTAGVYPVPGAATAKELDAQRARHVAYRRTAYNYIMSTGGCRSENIPTEYAIYCFDSETRQIGASHD